MVNIESKFALAPYFSIFDPLKGSTNIHSANIEHSIFEKIANMANRLKVRTGANIEH